VRFDILQRSDIATRINSGRGRYELFGQQEGLCGGCRHEFPLRNYTVDDVIPRSQGGTDHLDDLQLLCFACNSVKGNRMQEYVLPRLSDLAAVGPSDSAVVLVAGTS
jgi:site-specific DNA-methyltransferase (adenine-specific)